MFGKTTEQKEDRGYGQPLVYDESNYYYIPKYRAAATSNQKSSIGSYAISDFRSVVDINVTIGYGSCKFENIVLVSKDLSQKKNLFDKNSFIDSFFILDSKQTVDHPSLSQKIFVVSRRDEESTRTLSVCNLDGTDMKTLTTDAANVVSLNFDLKLAKAFVLLKVRQTSGTELAAIPYVIDLKNFSQAVSLFA